MTALFSWAQSLHHAMRGLRRAPGFSGAVLASLVICLGPNAAVLSALYALVVRPLPFPAPDQLCTVLNVAAKSGGQRVQSSTTQYVDFQTHANLFAGFATIRHESTALEDAARITLDRVSAGFFGVLGVEPVLGRFFVADEEKPGRDRVVVLAQSFWEARYQADPSVVGRKLLLGDEPATIIGVAPRRVEGLSVNTALFQPYAPAASRFDIQTRYRGDIALIARLRPGVSRAAGLAQLNALEATFRAEKAGPPLRTLVAAAGYRLALEPLRPGGAVGGASSLWLLQGGALLVFLIGAANAANLFLARLQARRTELAIRVALGAGRAALLRQASAESFLLTTAAAVAGLGLAWAALRVFNAYLPVLVPGAPPVSLDLAIIGTTLAVAAGIALFVAFVPLHLLWRQGLRLGETRTVARRTRAAGVLIATQVAVAVILLVGASLLLRSFAKVVAVDPGFAADRIVEARLTLPNHYAGAAARLDAQRRIVAAFRDIPGVDRVGVSLQSVLLANERPVPFGVRSEAVAGANESQHLIHIAAVSPDFFPTLGLRVVSGRTFDDADEFPRRPVAVVDETFVQRYFPGQNVEGQELYLNWGFPLGVDGWLRIVGVVSHARLTGLDSGDHLPLVYVSTAGYASGGFTALLHSTRAAPEVLREMRARLAQIDPAITLSSTGTLGERLDQLLLARRGITLLLGAFSALALLLAAIGLYGMLAHDVAHRTREIGIRGAIGASRGQILRLIVGEGMRRTAWGLAAGVVGAFFLTRYLGAFLFGIAPADVISYVIPLGLLVVVTLLASWFPAHRAAAVDPIVALREE
jgi:putative ABC transport system permease protein